MKTLKVLSWITAIVGTLWVALGIVGALANAPVAGIGYIIVFGAIFTAQGILTLRHLGRDRREQLGAYHG